MPPVVVDCSQWETDIPDDQWCVGELVPLVRSLPSVEVDCSTWGANPADCLELAASLDAGAAAEVIERANRLMAAAAAAGPDLELTHDFARSRTAGGDVVIAMRPQRPATPERLREVAAAVERAAAGLPGVRRVVVTVAGAA